MLGRRAATLARLERRRPCSSRDILQRIPPVASGDLAAAVPFVATSKSLPPQSRSRLQGLWQRARSTYSGLPLKNIAEKLDCNLIEVKIEME
jgi:hypothetical protein